MEYYTAQEPHIRKRLDVFLAEQGPQASRSQIKKWIEEERVTVNGIPAKTGYRLKFGDRISVNPSPPVPLSLEPEPIPLSVVWEDQNLLVVDKPAGLVVHPAPGHYDGTLVHALLHHCRDLSGIGGVLRPGIVHRLDKDTSGLLVVAKNDRTHRDLIDQFQSGRVSKDYQVLVWGRPAHLQGRIDRPIGRHPIHRKKMAVTDLRSKPAVTEWQVRELYSSGVAWLQVRIRTGRTHQIRVHLASIGLPVLGDPLYGPKKGGRKNPAATGSTRLETVSRQMLHAARLSFDHPLTGERLKLESALPPDMAGILAELKNP